MWGECFAAHWGSSPFKHMPSQALGPALTVASSCHGSPVHVRVLRWGMLYCSNTVFPFILATY